jgi:hypothetical protein
MPNLTTREAHQLGIIKGPAPKPGREDGYKSQWEADFARHLEYLKGDGVITAWGYEQVRLRIGKRSDRAKMRAPTFTPDFHAIWPDGHLVFYEVKGFYREAAKVRGGVAAAVFPYFTFVVVRKEKGVWQSVETFNAPLPLPPREGKDGGK